MVLTLYKVDASPPVRTVLMTIQALNIEEVEYVDINILAGEHLREEFVKLNPEHTVPTLKDDDFVIWDSHAIAGYLISKYSDDSYLYPYEAKRRAMVDQRLHFDTGILFPALRDTIVPVIFKGENFFQPGHLEKINSAYSLANTFLTTSPWMAGEEITLADISCIATISSMNEIVPVDEDIFPNLAAWTKKCAEPDFYHRGNSPGLEVFRELLKSKLA